MTNINKETMKELQDKAAKMYEEQKLPEDPSWHILPTHLKRLWIGEAAEALGYNNIIYDPNDE